MARTVLSHRNPGLTANLDERSTAVLKATCNSCNREREIIAKGQCRSCYAMAWRKKNAGRHRFTCVACGKEFAHHKRTALTCSLQCTWAIKSHAAKGEQAESLVVMMRERSPFAALRRAIEADDGPATLVEIRRHVQINEHTGCWEWAGSKVQKGNGWYACLDHNRRRYYVHRLSARAMHGALDPQESVVHHACHVTYCVNPEHLFPVSQRENNVEMLERRFYLARIESLEAALRMAVPTHELLNPTEVT